MKRECNIILETILQYKKESTMKNIKVSALASLLVNVLNIVFPLLTNPYLMRILSANPTTVISIPQIPGLALSFH